jgi:hypothetical protein
MRLARISLALSTVGAVVAAVLLAFGDRLSQPYVWGLVAVPLTVVGGAATAIAFFVGAQARIAQGGRLAVIAVLAAVAVGVLLVIAYVSPDRGVDLN